MYSKQRGFTVPELIIAMAIAGMILIGVIVILVNLISNSSNIIRTTEQIRTNQSVLSTIQADMALTESFLAIKTAAIPDPDQAASPLGAAVGWQFQGHDENSRILILNTYATTTTAQNKDRRIVYINDNLGGCPIGIESVKNNIIYFLSDNTLYRRTLPATPAANTLCPGQTIGQGRTCRTPSQATGSTCREKDVVVATNVRSFRVQYFAEPTDAEPRADVYTQETTEAANTALRTLSTVRVEVESTTANPEDTPLLSSYRKMTKGNSREL